MEVERKSRGAPWVTLRCHANDEESMAPALSDEGKFSRVAARLHIWSKCLGLDGMGV